MDEDMISRTTLELHISFLCELFDFYVFCIETSANTTTPKNRHKKPTKLT